jgi:hypothetical protein
MVYVTVAGTGIGVPVGFEVGKGAASSGSPWVIAGEKTTESALRVSHVKVVDAPATTVVGLAPNCVICGTPSLTVTDTV